MNHNLRFAIIPLRDVSKDLEKDYLSAYETYHLVWNETFKDLFGADYKLFSNDFTRQDFIQALFLGDQCIALDLIRQVDLKNPVDLDDSWLKSWSSDELSKLVWRGHEKCLINSYFTVHPDFRRSFGQHQINAGFLMGCLSVLHQTELNVTAMLGMMRNNRSMNALGKMLGSSLIAENIIHNSIPSDLVVFLKENIEKASKTFPEYAFDLFNNKTDYTIRGKNERAA